MWRMNQPSSAGGTDEWIMCPVVNCVIVQVQQAQEKGETTYQHVLVSPQYIMTICATERPGILAEVCPVH